MTVAVAVTAAAPAAAPQLQRGTAVEGIAGKPLGMAKLRPEQIAAVFPVQPAEPVAVLAAAVGAVTAAVFFSSAGAAVHLGQLLRRGGAGAVAELFGEGSGCCRGAAAGACIESLRRVTRKTGHCIHLFSSEPCCVHRLLVAGKGAENHPPPSGLDQGRGWSSVTLYAMGQRGVNLSDNLPGKRSVFFHSKRQIFRPKALIMGLFPLGGAKRWWCMWMSWW